MLIQVDIYHLHGTHGTGCDLFLKKVFSGCFRVVISGTSLKGTTTTWARKNLQIQDKKRNENRTSCARATHVSLIGPCFPCGAHVGIAVVMQDQTARWVMFSPWN